MTVNIQHNDDGSLGFRGENDTATHGAFIPVTTEWNASSVDKVFFTATRPCKVKAATARVTVAGTDGSAVTAQLRKVASGTAITSGTVLLAGDAAEDTDFDFASHTISSGGESLTFNTPGTAYYIWFTVDGAGSDPEDADRGIEVAILSTDTDAQVASKVQAAVDAVGELTATVSTTTVTIVNDVAGSVTDAADVSTSTGVTPSVQTQGTDTSINLKGTADTNQSLSLTSVDRHLSLAEGESLALDFTGTLTSATGALTVMLCLE